MMPADTQMHISESELAERLADRAWKLPMYYMSTTALMLIAAEQLRKCHLDRLTEWKTEEEQRQ